MKARRYRSRSEGDSLALEVSFTGAVEIGEDNPRRTNVVATAWERIEHAPGGWAELWSVRHGNLRMPSGPWHGFCLAAVIGEGLYAALGSELSHLDLASGACIWRRATGNTPIRQILPLTSGGPLLVLHGYYRFDAGGEGRSNLSAVTLEGELLWHAKLPNRDDAFVGWIRSEGDELVTATWGGFECRLSAADGSILRKRWTK